MLSDKLKQSGIEALENLADFVHKTEVEKQRLVRHLEGKSEVDHAFEMGRSFHEDGPDGINCHFTLFCTVELKDAWERGFNDAKMGGA
jgi:hypothetical protein